MRSVPFECKNISHTGEPEILYGTYLILENLKYFMAHGSNHLLRFASPPAVAEGTRQRQPRALLHGETPHQMAQEGEHIKQLLFNRPNPMRW